MLQFIISAGARVIKSGARAISRAASKGADVTGASKVGGLIRSVRSAIAQTRFSAKITINHNQLVNKINRASDKRVQEVMEYALDEVKRLTPIDKGKARRGWHLRGKGTNTQLVNNVEYIEYLENGHSKQAPKGMLKPLKKKIRGKFK